MNSNYDDGRTDREKRLLPEWAIWPIAFVLGMLATVAGILIVAGLLYLYRNYTDTWNTLGAIFAFLLLSGMFAAWIRELLT